MQALQQSPAKNSLKFQFDQENKYKNLIFYTYTFREIFPNMICYVARLLKLVAHTGFRVS